MIGCVARLARCTKGTPATEFALVLPALTLFLLGIIDVGRLMWAWNQASKATQMGVRFAVVTDFVPEDLRDHDFALSDGIPGGDPVPTEVFDETVCHDGTCTNGWDYDGVAFGKIVFRMQRIMPNLTAANVTVTYKNVELGFAGDPNGSDVAPLVTVRLETSFSPAIGSPFGFTIPVHSLASLTMEDALGDKSN